MRQSKELESLRQKLIDLRNQKIKEIFENEIQLAEQKKNDLLQKLPESTLNMTMEQLTQNNFDLNKILNTQTKRQESKERLKRLADSSKYATPKKNWLYSTLQASKSRRKYRTK